MRFSLDYNWQSRYKPVGYKGSTMEPDSIYLDQPTPEMPRLNKTSEGSRRRMQQNLVLRSQPLKMQNPRERRHTYSIDGKPSLLLAQSTLKRTHHDPPETLGSQDEGLAGHLGTASNNLQPSSQLSTTQHLGKGGKPVSSVRISAQEKTSTRNDSHADHHQSTKPTGVSSSQKAYHVIASPRAAPGEVATGMGHAILEQLQQHPQSLAETEEDITGRQ